MLNSQLVIAASLLSPLPLAIGWWVHITLHIHITAIRPQPLLNTHYASLLAISAIDTHIGCLLLAYCCFHIMTLLPLLLLISWYCRHYCHTYTLHWVNTINVSYCHYATHCFHYAITLLLLLIIAYYIMSLLTCHYAIINIAIFASFALRFRHIITTLPLLTLHYYVDITSVTCFHYYYY